MRNRIVIKKTNAVCVAQSKRYSPNPRTVIATNDSEHLFQDAGVQLVYMLETSKNWYEKFKGESMSVA